MSNLNSINKNIELEKKSVNDSETLEKMRLKFLGKKGEITLLMKDLGKMDPEERKAKAEELNKIKDSVNNFINLKSDEFEDDLMSSQLASEKQDLTLDSKISDGRIHPITQVIDEVIAIFTDLDFCVAEGPEVETDYNNFTALNTSENHPARQMHDTFYVNSETDGMLNVLRTHTSPVQIRSMLEGKPPFRLIAVSYTHLRAHET